MSESKSARRLMLRFGLRVREERLRCKFTQEQLAEKLGLAPRWMQDIEAGTANLTLSSIAALCGALGVEANELFLPPAKSTVRRPGRPKAS